MLKKSFRHSIDSVLWAVPGKHFGWAWLCLRSAWRTRTAFEAKLQRSSRTTDFRVPQSICTMFNVMVDAKAQTAKLCTVDLGQEVGCLPRNIYRWSDNADVLQHQKENSIFVKRLLLFLSFFFCCYSLMLNGWLILCFCPLSLFLHELHLSFTPSPPLCAMWKFVRQWVSVRKISAHIPPPFSPHQFPSA